MQPAALDDALVAALDAVMPRYLRVLRHALTAAEGDDRLTLSQLRCLQLMADTDGPALTTRLARALLVTPPTMTRTIDILVERGLVERQPDPVNRRQIGLVLTPAGRTALARYETIMRDRLRGLVGRLPEEAKQRLLAATTDIATMLDADEWAGEGRA
ncbi:MAG TPA: MarR family winged helix-turn-helix transcriptional regulator [Thermomicrobiales bacterium]|nr:MarR family winged helix-turn-helix transcriptional regulator [Thermomicrobiales bacterium]